MQIQRTIPIITKTCRELVDTVREYNAFQQAISPIAFNQGNILSAVDLHHKVYYTVSTELSSQMRCSAIRSVASAYVSARTNRRPAKRAFLFKRQSALFQWGKDFSFTRNDLLSISTIKGRKKLPFTVPAYALQDFKQAVKYNSITITEEGRIYLCLTLEVPEPVGIVPVGIDLGATNALVASTETDTLFISGIRQKIANKRTRKTRQRLLKKLNDRKAQHRDTRSVSSKSEKTDLCEKEPVESSLSGSFL